MSFFQFPLLYPCFFYLKTAMSLVACGGAGRRKQKNSWVLYNIYSLIPCYKPYISRVYKSGVFALPGGAP